MNRENIIYLITMAVLLALLPIQPQRAAAAPGNMQAKTDSLNALLKERKGEERADVLRQLFRIYFSSNQVELAYSTLDELIRIESKQNRPELEASARWNKIALLNNSGRYDSLYTEAGEQMKWFEEQKMWDRYYQAWQRKCSASHDLGRIQLALREARSMLKDAQQRNNNVGRAMAYKQMGVVYYDIRQLTLATESFERSVALLVEEHDSTGMLSGVYEGLCQSLDGQKKYQQELQVAEAWAAHMKSLLSKHGIMNVSPTLVTCYMAHAAAHIGLNELEEAHAAIKTAQEYQAEANSALTSYYVLEMQTRLALAEGQLQKALAYSDSALALKLTVDDELSVLRAKTLLQAGRTAEAALLYERLYHHKDTLYTHALQSQMDEQRALMQLDDMEKRQQRMRNRVSYGIGGGIILALVVFLIYRHQEERKQKQLNEQLSHANKKAQESARMKSEFIKNISHEIRTPLNVLNGFSQIVLSPGIEMDDDTKRNIRERIHENTERITDLINKMLELSDVNSQAVIDQSDDTDPEAPAAQAAIDAHLDLHPELNFHIEAAADTKALHLHTNKQQLTRVLTLLLDNAIKFSKQGDVTVRINTTADGRKLQYMIEDKGIGVPASEAEHIFEEFVQLDEYVDGTGIGLTVARNLARRLHGDICLDTTYTDGARFVFTLPIE